MSGWIDPLGTRALIRFIRSQQLWLRDMADDQERRYPRSRRAARFRARHDELSRMMMLIQAVQRPGHELLPHKMLVQQGSPETRRAIIETLVPRKVA